MSNVYEINGQTLIPTHRIRVNEPDEELAGTIEGIRDIARTSDDEIVAFNDKAREAIEAALDPAAVPYEVEAVEATPDEQDEVATRRQAEEALRTATTVEELRDALAVLLGIA